MKELNHCSECDKRMSEEDKDRNRECGIDSEEWTCIDCENQYD